MWYIEFTSKNINTNTTDCSKDAKTIFIYYFLAFVFSFLLISDRVLARHFRILHTSDDIG